MHSELEEAKAKTEEIGRLNEQLHLLLQNIKKEETKMIILDRSRAALTSKMNDLQLDVETAIQKREGLIEKQKELSFRMIACSESEENNNVQITQVQRESDSNYESLIELDNTIRKLVARQKELELCQEKLVVQIAHSTSSIQSLGAKLQNVKRYKKMIENELRAIKKVGTDKQKKLKPKQQEILEQKLESLEQQLKQINQQISVHQKEEMKLKDRSVEMARETRHNNIRITTIKCAIPEINNIYLKLKDKLQAMKIEKSRLVEENVSLMTAKGEAKKLFAGLNRRIIQLQKEHGEMKEKRLTMTHEKKECGKRLQDLKLSKKKMDRKKKKLEATVELLNIKRQKLNETTIQKVNQETPGVFNVRYETKNNSMVEGCITVTSFLVIFEPLEENERTNESKEDDLKFCVEVPDVEECIVIRVRPKKNSNVDQNQFVPESCATELKLLIRFKPHYENLFLFDEETGEILPSSILDTDFYFSGDKDTLETVCSAIRHSIDTHQSEQRRNSLPATLMDGKDLSDNLLVPIGSDISIYSASHEDPTEAEIIGKSEILSYHQLQSVLKATSDRFKLEKWKLIYSMVRDGVDLNRFYECAEDSNSTGCVLILQDMNKKIFGGHSTQTWRVSSGFYGDGECFVFAFDDKGELQIYTSSGGKGNHFMYSDKTKICFGGGDHSNFAISLDSSFSKGTSGPCETFNSPQLTSEDLFHCCMFEVWSPTGGQSYADEFE